MFSVASLLNPAPKEPRIGLPSSPSSSSHCTTPSSTYGTPPPSTRPNPIFKQKMTKDGAVFVKGKTKGDVNYSPFDCLDEDSTREVQRFQVKPFGAIGEYARHIPYNSEKKSFLEKTGRESFEVFQYEFKVPGDEKVYTVMWDYNIGLVRITPFFKCCKYSKTTPAKMLNMNPGLKEITHSITGGALVAQGYWMPYSCALAVCTTFCARIAGALIPIFGPKFPSQCVPLEAPEHGRMIIDSSLVIDAAAQAERYRQKHSSYIPPGKSCSSRDSYSPQQRVHERSPLPNTRQTPDMHLSKRLRFKRAFTGDSPTSDTDFDRAGSETSGEGYFTPSTPSPTQMHQQSYRHQNAISHSANSSINFNISPIHAHQTPGPNPLLSAIPRSTGFNDVNAMGSRVGTWRQVKRRADEVDADDEAEYECEESTTASIADDKASVDADANTSNDNDNDKEMEDVVPGGVEKKAAYLLMNLNIKDRESASASASASANSAAKKDGGPRVKRLRATSM